MAVSPQKEYVVKLQDLIIDPRSLGNKLWLVEGTPAYEYKEGRRTENVTGYRYTVALPEKGLEKIGVKVDGAKLMDAPESGFVEVKFDNLELYFYWSNGQPNVAARATNISLVNTKN